MAYYDDSYSEDPQLQRRRSLIDQMDPSASEGQVSTEPVGQKQTASSDPLQPSPVPQAQDNYTNAPPPSPVPGSGPIPTNSNGSQVGANTPWAPGASAPSTAPPGYHWDANLAMFQPDAAGAASSSPNYSGGGDNTILQLLQSGMDPQQAISLFNQTNGRGTGNEAVYYNDNRGQTIGLPSGYAALTPQGWTWTTRGPEGLAGGGAPANLSAMQSGQLSPEISNYFKTLTDQINAQIAQNQQLMDARRQSLLQLMQQGQTPVDTQNDPILRGATDAYRNERQRGAQQERAALAERAAFTGLNPGGQGSGSFDTGIQGINEGASRDVSSYNANLAVNEMNQRRNALVQAIQIADAIGARSESQQLNSTLAQIDAAIKQQQLGLSYAQLGQQQGQFEDNTALQYAQLLAQNNRDALLYGLNG